MWNANENTFEENARFCQVRAIEWSAWPSFISQPIAPIAFLYYTWQEVFGAMIAANILWAIFVRYEFVNVSLAYWGCLFVRLKWIACPVGAIVLFGRNQIAIGLVALFWPIVVMIVGPLTSLGGEFGRIELMFMRALGYQAGNQN
jgi:hypothetical protein